MQQQTVSVIIRAYIAPVSKCKSIKGFGSMLLREILKLRSSEINGSVYFLFIFASLKSSKRAATLHKNETLHESLKSGGHVSPMPLGSYASEYTNIPDIIPDYGISMLQAQRS